MADQAPHRWVQNCGRKGRWHKIGRGISVSSDEVRAFSTVVLYTRSSSFFRLARLAAFHSAPRHPSSIRFFG